MAERIEISPAVNEFEKWAFDFLVQNLPDDYTVITGAEIKNEYNRSYDCDVIVIGACAVYVVELKGYQGKQTFSSAGWFSNGNYRKNPIQQVKHNVHVVAGKLRSVFKNINQRPPWVEAIVFVTGGCGGNVILDSSFDNEPVYTKENIINILTNPKKLSVYNDQNVFSDRDKKIIKNALYDLNLVRMKNMKFGDYQIGKKLRDHNNIVTYVTEYKIGSDYRKTFLLKKVSYANIADRKKAESAKTRLQNEFFAYDTVKGTPGIPIVNHWIDDGIQAGFTLPFPYAKSLSSQMETFSVEEKLYVIEKIASTLFTINEKGVFCRDLSSDNIHYSSKSKEVLLYTFEFSQMIDSSSTIQGHISGLPQFIAPELIHDFSNASEFSDSFSLGTIVLRLFCLNKEQFTSTDTIIKKIDTAKFSDEFVTELSELHSWLLRSLEKDPNNRANIEELLLILRKRYDYPENVSTKVLNIAVGEIIDNKYKLLENLGQGGCGEVWKAFHLQGKFDVALKLFKTDTTYSFDIVQEEFSALRTLYHPHIVREFDIDRISNSSYAFITMAFVNGFSLFDYIKDTSIDHSVTDILKWFRQSLEVLNYLHSLKTPVLHKDIKPDNIMIDELGNVCLIDFGLSISGEFYEGTMEYQCPSVREQYRMTPYSDLWALALTFYEVLLKKRAIFRGEIGTYWGIKLEEQSPTGFPQDIYDKICDIVTGKIRVVDEDYLEFFGLADAKVEQPIFDLPEKLKDEFNITSKAQIGMVLALLSLPRKLKTGYAKSRVYATHCQLRNIANRQKNHGAYNSAISVLKNNSVIAYYGNVNPKKVELTTEFLKRYEELK